MNPGYRVKVVRVRVRFKVRVGVFRFKLKESGVKVGRIKVRIEWVKVRVSYAILLTRVHIGMWGFRVIPGRHGNRVGLGHSLYPCHVVV